MVLYRVDLTIPENRVLQRRYGVRGLPTTLVLDSDGTEAGRIVGYPGRTRWLRKLNRIRRATPETIPEIDVRH